MDDIFFEDVVPGTAIQAGPYVVPEQELVSFGSTWDPPPMHVDKAFALQHGGLTAPGIYLLAIKMRLAIHCPCGNRSLPRSVMTRCAFIDLRIPATN
jgi:acyl dehydratase